MNKTRMTGGEQGRTIDDAQVRAAATHIEISLEAISYYAGDLKARLDVLHKELEFADPVKDRMFEKFLYKLMRLTMPLQTLGELKELAKAMQEFGLPHAAEVREIMRQTRDPNKVGTDSLSVRLKNVEKHLTKELVHA